MTTHYPLFPAQYPRQIWIKLYPTFPATFEAYGEATFWRIKLKQISHHVLGKPRNSSNIHPWWTQMKNIMNIQHSDEEHSNILMFILGTQQHSDGQNVHPDFQVKACGAQDTWHNTIGHPTMAIWAQRLYKYRSKAQQNLHDCKAYKKTTWFCLKLLQSEIDQSLRLSSLSAHQYSLLSLR